MIVSKNSQVKLGGMRFHKLTPLSASKKWRNANAQYFNHAVLLADEEAAACQEIRSIEIRFWYSALQSPFASDVFLNWLRTEKVSVPPDVLTATEDEIRQLIREDADRSYLREVAKRVEQAKEPRNRAWQKKVRKLADESIQKTNEFLSYNYRLVAAYCKKYVDKRGESSGMNISDVMQEGCLGLLRAIHRFDPTRNLRFSTYATHWIRATIGRSLSDHSRIVRIPVHLLEAAQSIKGKAREYFVKTGAPITPEELCKTGRRSLRRNAELLRFIDMDSPMLYLEQGSEDERRSSSKISFDHLSNGERDPEEQLLAAERRKVLEHLTVLAPLESLILRWRLGLESEEMNMREISDELNVSRERVRQLYEKAIRHLKDVVSNPDEEEVDIDSDDLEDLDSEDEGEDDLDPEDLDSEDIDPDSEDDIDVDIDLDPDSDPESQPHPRDSFLRLAHSATRPTRQTRPAQRSLSLVR